MKREVNHQADKPFPLPIQIWNLVGRVSSPKLTLDKLLNKAKRNTGLSDFGEPFFMEPLERLLESINSEARLHAFGNFVTKTRLVNLLSNRLRAEEFLKKNPQVLEEDLKPIWWIVGLQRTGTTFLQRLLASNPSAATVYSWEALNPVPFEKDVNNKQRIQAAKKSEKGLKYIAPEFFAIHPVEHLKPEEEILLLDISFMSTVAEATLNVPSYAEWLARQNQEPAYIYMKKLLKILQHQKGKPKRWILKSPHHMEFPETLVKVFPETSIIQTHRDPLETIASFCSMIYFSRKVFSKHLDKNKIANQWLAKTKLMLDRMNSFRKSNVEIKLHDISYNQLMTDPLNSLRELHQVFEEELTHEAEEYYKLALSENKKNKYGSHIYNLESFGLNAFDLEKDFDNYKKIFSEYI